MSVIVATEDEAPIDLVVNLFLGYNEVLVTSLKQRVGRSFCFKGTLFKRRSLGERADHICSGHNRHRRADRSVVVNCFLILGINEYVVYLNAGVLRVSKLKVGEVDAVRKCARYCVMRVLCSVEDVSAAVDLITGTENVVKTCPVVSCDVISIERYGNFLALAGCERIGLCEADKANGSLLDLVLDVRSFHVNLYNVLTCYVAGVGNGYGCSEGRFGRDVRSRHFYSEIRPIERGVGKAVTERIYDVSVVPVVSIGVRLVSVAGAVDIFALKNCLSSFGRKVYVACLDLIIHRLVVLVSEIDTFLVLDNVAAGAFGLAFFILPVIGNVRSALVNIVVLSAVTEVLHYGINHKVARVDIHGSAGRIDFALEHLKDASETVVTRLTDVNYSVYIRIILKLTELDDVTGVEQDNDFLEFIFDVLYQLLLSVGKLKVVLFRIVDKIAILIRTNTLIYVLYRKVCALAAETTDNDECCVVVTVISSFDCRRVVVERKLLVLISRHRPSRRITHGTARILHVKFLKFGVDAETFRLKGRINVRTFLKLTGTGTRTAVTERIRVDTKHAYVLHIRVRKFVLVSVHAAAVLKKNSAFAGEFDVLGFRLCLKFFIAGERRVVMAHSIISVAHSVFICDLWHSEDSYR